MKIRTLLISLATLALAFAQPVPTPESHFGHAIGVDRELLDWDKVVSYFQALEKNSNRILVRELGKSTEGRPFITATISAPETIRTLDRYRVIQERLADPRKTSAGQAEGMVAEGKTVVMITCSIHSNEVASTHSAVQFAYDLLTKDTPKFRAILDNTILILVPSLNPDGVDIVTKWYRRTLGTPYEGTSPPELYHKYVGHDNNRDWYIFSQVETRLTISQLQNVWHPQIVYDVHQQGPFASRMFVPPWMDPVDPNIDPIITQECNSVGSQMAADLTAAGKKGVVINALYDFWTASRHYQAYHAGLRILSESASARLATPIVVRPEQIQSTAPGYNPRERSWNYLEPWEGGTWRLRDIVDYQLIAMESLMYQAAVRRVDLLRNFYEIGRKAVARRSPYAFVIPRQQNDAGAARKMLELLQFGAVEVERAGTPFAAGGKPYPAGSFVIRMQQPYSSYAKTLLERQHYPDLRQSPGGPPKRPYDVTAQTLPLLMGVTVDTVEQPFSASLEPAGKFDFEQPGNGILPASDVDSWKAVNSAWSVGETVWRDPANGDFYLRSVPGRNLMKLDRPRIGLYRSHMPTMDEGWTRWLFEQFGFAYRNIANAEIQAGGLRQKYDAIVFPDQTSSSITEGFKRGAMPDEYTGGVDETGAAHLKEFATEGGTLVFLNHSTEYAVDVLGVPVKNIVRGLPDRDYYVPGSLLNVTLERDPLTWGVPEEIAIWAEASPAWDVPSGGRDRVLARYTKSNVLASGWLLGAKHIEGRAALVESPIGNGRVVLFGMRPQYRAQSYQTFLLFFNSLLLHAEASR
jgi:hypothetical protein